LEVFLCIDNQDKTPGAYGLAVAVAYARSVHYYLKYSPPYYVWRTLPRALQTPR